MKALVAGASGLVGREVVSLLLRDPAVDAVTLVVRKPIAALSGPKLTQVSVDFDRLGDSAATIRGDELYVCLGTTMKVAGSKEAFRKVDFTYVVELARLAAAAGVTKCLVVSSSGADPKSSIFYSRVKGEMEDAVSALPFATTAIFRPSLLLGERAESRPGERIGIALGGALAFAFVGPLRRYRPIAVADVAAAMVAVARGGSTGKRVYESDEIQALAQRRRSPIDKGNPSPR